MVIPRKGETVIRRRIVRSPERVQSLLALALLAILAFATVAQTNLEIRTDKLPLAEVERYYSAQLLAGPNIEDVRWSAVGSLPEGMSLDPLSGILSGTPSTVGQYHVTVSVEDRQGTSVSKSFAFYVLDYTRNLEELPPTPPPAASAKQSTLAATALADESQGALGFAVQASEPAYLGELLDILDATEEGNWVRVNLNFFEDVWAPPELQPLKGVGPSSPSRIIAAWSSFAWDPNRGDLWLYGGGHANSSGNDVYRWRGTTRSWERASLPSENRLIATSAIRSPRQPALTAISGLPAPNCWPTRVAAALATPHAGRMMKITTRIAIT